MSFVVSVAALTAVYVSVARLERWPSLRFRTLPSPRPYLATDLAWYGLAIAATALSVFVLRAQLAKLEITPLRRSVTSLPIVAQLLLGIVIFDFVSFAVHVGLHRSNFLWNVHKVHHSSLHLDGFATTRTHMFENLVRFVPGQAVLFLIGMPASVVAPTVALAAIYGVSNHSNLRVNLAWAEGVFITPRLHRRHHVPATTQHNFGAIFTVWDRAFGTLVRRDTMRGDRYGVPGEIETFPQTFVSAFREPLRQMSQAKRQRRRDARPVSRVDDWR
jgi:sterol desaturase/sphingolipid hydroxylase (fatty acid hydroxylase superfamily)